MLGTPIKQITDTDPQNEMFSLAAEFVLHTDAHVFLTGKAGTGKTTFLKYIKDKTTKACAVVAPTGIAAINAGGETLHSFLQLPTGPYLPDGGNGTGAETKHGLLSRLRLRETKISLLRKLELLIIDEVSMVRADLLDAADAVLRHVRKNYLQPFGGVQVLYIGDLYQLPPVVQQAEAEILRTAYEGFYFFDARVIQEQRPVYLELDKVYRQQDETFIQLLNRVRTGATTYDDIDLLNERYQPKPVAGKGTVWLCTHNQAADEINQRELAKLTPVKYMFTGKVSGDFNIRNVQAEETLILKEGAQVMFIKNDMNTPRRYYNGKIGTVSSVNDEQIVVSFPGEPATASVTVEKELWRNIKYSLDGTGKIVEDELGSFTQYPLKLAWAITVHKSQGLTLEKVILDLSASFAPGQVYVALSRCTAFAGITLATEVALPNIITDRRLNTAFPQQNNNTALQQALITARQHTFYNNIHRLFSFTELTDELRKLSTELSKRKIGPADRLIVCANINELVEASQQTCAKFYTHAEKIFLNGDFPQLEKRAGDACRHFTEVLLMPVLQIVDEHLLFYESYTGVSKQVRMWKNFRELVHRKMLALVAAFNS